MRRRRTAAVAIAIAGAFGSPLCLAQQQGGIGGLTPEGHARIEALRKSMEPQPYTPPLTACEKWKGRELIAKYDPTLEPTGCVAQCSVKLVDVSGKTGRWQITGQPCTRR